MSSSSDNSGHGNDRLSVDRMRLMKIPELQISSLNKTSSLDQCSSTDKAEDSAPNGFLYRGGFTPLSIESGNYSNSQTSLSSFSTSSSGSMVCSTAKELDASKINTLELEKNKQNVSMEVDFISEKLAEMETVTRNVMSSKCDEDERKGETEKSTSNAIQYRRYTLEDIEIATDYFSPSLKVGEGGYGPVYRAVLDNTQVAIKVLRPDVSQGLKQFQKEVEVLGRMKHPNLVLLLGACPEYGCLVYELMDYGSLEDRLFRKNNTPPIPWRTRFKMAFEIATALHFLHSTKPEPLVHRDLKPANILLDQNFAPKICDVGLARLVPPAAAENMTQYHMTAAAGTFFYIDPEYQQTGLLSVKSDIYSLGVVFLQIITGRPAMGLSYAVENAIEEGNFAKILDPAVDGWPVEEALSFARMALKCCELRKRDRPDLGSEMLPELTRLSAYAVSGTSISLTSYEDTSCSSSYAGSPWMSQESVASNSDLDMFIQPYQLRPDEDHSSSSL